MMIERDCMAAITLINEQLRGATMTTLVQKIEKATRHFEMVRFLFIRREDNMVED